MKNEKAYLSLLMSAILFFSSITCAYSLEKSVEEKLSKIEKALIADGKYKESLSELNSMIVKLSTSASGNDRARLYLDVALAYYGMMDYNEADKNFKIAGEFVKDSEVKKFVLYSLNVCKENSDLLENIQKFNNEYSATDETGKITVDEALKDQIISAHAAMIDRLAKGKHYYPAIVLPHILWLIGNTPEQAELYKFAAGIYYMGMFYKEAENYYEKALKFEKDDPKLYEELANTEVALGNLDKADDEYQKAIEAYKKKGLKDKDPGIVKLMNIKQALPKKYGDIAKLVENKSFSEAEEVCKKRLSLNSGDIAALTQLGEIYWKTGKKQQAIKLFRKTIKIAPDYPTAHLMLGKAYIFERKPEKGIMEFKIFKEKMRILPEKSEDTTDFYVSGLQYIAYIYTTLQMYNEALKEYQEAVKLKPVDPKTHYNLAICYYAGFNSRVKAYNEMQKVIEIGTDTELTEKAKFYIDYMRRNPDSRIVGSVEFIYED
ncbi:MAG: tetratricopeptide repeat protein [Candidatus Omnitrophica bacterium]|nr:tetratricopeptide repeat protein [Candidatus Omnitrophota bacterium]